MASRSDGINLLASFINFGALTAFLALHLSVISHYVIRQRSREQNEDQLFHGRGLGLMTTVSGASAAG